MNEILKKKDLGQKPTFTNEIVAAALSGVYEGVIFRCNKALDENKFPVIYGTQAIGKSGVIIPALMNSDNPPTVVLEAVGWRRKDINTFERAVAFVTLRGSYNIEQQIVNDVVELKKMYPELAEKEAVLIEATFRPRLSHVKDLLKQEFGTNLPALEDEWLESELNQIIDNLPNTRPLQFLLNRCLDLYENTKGFKKNKFKEFRHSFLKKSKHLIFGKGY